MHKYVEVSNDEKIVGKNGTYQIELDRKNLLDKNGLYSGFYSYFNGFSFFQRQVEAFNYEAPVINSKKIKKAKITDFMGYGPWITAFPWLISERFYQVLSEFNIGKHKIFQVDIEGCNEKYYFLHKYNILKFELKFQDTIVSVGQNDLNNYREYTFNSYEEYSKFDNENLLCEFRVIAVDKNFEQEDIIYTQSGGNYFSERLINAIEASGCTGLRVKDDCQIKFV